MSSKITQYAQHFVLEGPYLPWRWSKDLSCVEWSDGSTLCFREEIEEILDEVATDEWVPELQDVLCVLAALYRRTPTQLNDLGHFIRMKKDQDGGQLSKDIIFRIHNFLRLLNELPKDLKQKRNRLALFHLLFSSPKGTSSTAQKMGPVTAFRQGALDQVIRRLEQTAYKTSPSDPVMFIMLSSHYRELPQLEQAVRTKLQELPKPAELELPPPTAEDLLTTLSQDEKTAGLANIARQLVAIIDLPNTSRAASDLPLGGIADITNRGDLSKLLLSELANDEDTLTARLVNNEALFYQQEAPPVRPPAKRVVLIDNTIRLWGSPRMISLSAALSIGHSASDTVYYVVAGSGYSEIKLSNKEEVIEAIGSLSTELDCRLAIKRFLRNEPLKPDTELVFISEAAWIHRAEMQSTLSLLRQKLRYWVGVDRLGKVEVHRFIKGQRRLLLNGKVDTSPLLPEAKRAQSNLQAKDFFPKYLQRDKTPLYWPCENNRPMPAKIFAFSEKVFLTIDKYQRLLLWPKAQRGAIELAQQTPRGEYFLHKESRNSFSFLIFQAASNTVINYHYKFAGRKLEVDELNMGYPIEQVAYREENGVVLFYNDQWHTLEGEVVLAYITPGQVSGKTYLNTVYKRINKRCCTLRKIESIALSHYSGLIINNDKELRLDSSNDRLFFGDRRSHHIPSHPTTSVAAVPSYAKEAGFPVRSFIWPDGSAAYADRRGKLFLKSSNPDLPEITIITVVNHPAAAWASDGYACGQAFYTGGMEVGRTIKVTAFYEKYINPFIQQILSHEEA
jgi:hypothetical protein